MRRDEALEKLRQLKPRFGEMNIRRLALFGSTARDEARADSDVDLLVEFAQQPVGFFDLLGRQEELAIYLNCPVDLVVVDGVRHAHHQHILGEAINV